MSNIPISSLPLTTSVDGSEFVPIVQGGTTKRTTIADISTFPAVAGSFVMATLSPNLTSSRLLSAQSGVTTVTDGGPLGNITVGVATNGIGNTQLRQGGALSVIGNAGTATANVADIAGTAGQILRVNDAGTALGFGTLDLSNANTVGPNTLTLAGPLATVGAFSSTFTMTGATSVTFPTSGTLATTSGPALPSVALGSTLYGSAPNVLSALAGNITTGKQYLSQTGTGAVSAAPAWATVAGADITGAALTEVNDTNVTLTLGGTPSTALLRSASITAGWIGQLAVGRGGTGLASATAFAVLCGGTTTTGAFQSIASVGTTGQVLTSNGAGALPTFKSTASSEPVTQVTGASATISALTPAVAVVRASPTATALALPSVASQGGVPMHIFDWSSAVTGHTITLTPNGADTIMLAASFQVFSNSSQLGGVTLYPSTTLSGWYIAP